MAIIGNSLRWLSIHGIEAGAGQEGFGREGFDQGPDFGGLDPGSAAAGAGGQGIGGGGIGLEDDSGARIGETFVAPESITRQDLGEFSEFAQGTAGLFDKLGSFLGFGPEVTEAVKRGAEISDPAAFSAGQKAGVGFELAQSIAAFSGLPAAAAVGIVDRVVSAMQNPAFAVGRRSIENRLSAVAPVASTLAGIGTQSAGIARAVELGLNVAGVTTAGRAAGVLPEASAPLTERAASTESGVGPETQRLPERQIAQGATISTRTREIGEISQLDLPERESFGRSDLRVRRV